MGGYRSSLGTRGESLAAAFLQGRGYRIVSRNYHCRYGEIDLICTHEGTLVFCEVKLRRSTEFGAPEEAITPRKLARMTMAAQTYLAAHGQESADWRLDVVALQLDQRGAVARTALYQGVGG